MGVQRVSTGAQRPNGRSTPAVARPPVGLLQLQRAAGNAAVAGLIAARQVVTAAAAPTRPIFRLGDIDQQVGVAQQKLNVLGTTPELKIDAEFGSRTQLAVRTEVVGGGLLGAFAQQVARRYRGDRLPADRGLARCRTPPGAATSSSRHRPASTGLSTPTPDGPGQACGPRELAGDDSWVAPRPPSLRPRGDVERPDNTVTLVAAAGARGTRPRRRRSTTTSRSCRASPSTSGISRGSSRQASAASGSPDVSDVA